jgi:hypothetical protein
MPQLDSPGALDRFVAATEQTLRSQHHAAAADLLRDVRASAFTTGSEWRGELGLAVRRILAMGGLPAGLRQQLRRLGAAIRRR